MKFYEVKDTEAYWTKAVEDFFKLGLMEGVVPISNLDYDIAKAIASKLNARVKVSGTNYIFHRNAESKSVEKEQQTI